MYDTSDPRSTLAPAAGSGAARPAPTQFAAADIGKFYETAPQEDDANGKSWLIRSENAVIVYTDGATDDTVALVANIPIRRVLTDRHAPPSG